MRARTLGILASGLLAAACGDTSNERMTTGGLGGAAAGALVGGPVGAIVGGGIGVAGGAALDKSADQKINEVANQPTGETRQMASASGSADRGRMLTAEQVHRKLHNDGYTGVYNINRQGSTYLARGDLNGRAYDIRTDAYSGRIVASNDVGRAPVHEARSGSTASNLMSEQQVRDSLQRDGYEVVGPLSRSGSSYRTQVRQNNETQDVTVDRRSGRIVNTTQAPASNPGGGG